MTNSFRQQPSNHFSGSDGPPHQRDFNPRFQNGLRTFDNQSRPDNAPPLNSRVSGASSVSPPKELMMPVFQTRDRVEADWGAVMAATVSSSNNKLDTVTERSERSEQWAWGSGRDCNGISELTQIKLTL